jgi:putative endonuclease
MAATSQHRGARAQLGRRGEAVAETFLRSLGFRILARQHRCRRGEVDLIAEEGDCLCFVEVRTRSHGPVGALETVNGPKQRRVVRAALDYLARQGIPAVGARAMRFDVVEVEQSDGGELRPALLRNAFEAAE